MDNFFLHLKNKKRYCQMVPHILSLGYRQKDPPTYRATKRETVNIGIILSANFPEAAYEKDKICYKAQIPALVCITPGSLFRQSNPGPCEKIFFSYDANEANRFELFMKAQKDFIMPIENLPKFKEIIASIFRICREMRLPGNGDRLDMCCADLLCEAMLNKELLRKDNIEEQRDPIFSIASLVDMHFANKVNFDELARNHGMSPRTFMRKWKKHFKLSPHLYLLTRQLEEAQRLLVETEMKIYEIAEQTGFADSYYFSRCFKKKLGVSPNEFRHKNGIIRGNEVIL